MFTVRSIEQGRPLAVSRAALLARAIATSSSRSAPGSRSLCAPPGLAGKGPTYWPQRGHTPAACASAHRALLAVAQGRGWRAGHCGIWTPRCYAASTRCGLTIRCTRIVTRDAWTRWWCPSIAWMKGRRSDVDRSLVEPGVQVTRHAIVQQCLHGPHRVRHAGCHARRAGCHCLGDPAL